MRNRRRSGDGPNIWIAEELKKADRTQIELARFMGKSAVVVNRMICDPSRHLRADEDRKIREFLALPEVDLSKSNRIDQLEARLDRIERLLGLRRLS